MVAEIESVDYSTDDFLFNETGVIAVNFSNFSGSTVNLSDFTKTLRRLSKEHDNCNSVVLLGVDPLFYINIDFVVEFLINTDYEVTILTNYMFRELQDFGILPRLIGRIKYLKTGCGLPMNNQFLYDGSLNLIEKEN